MIEQRLDSLIYQNLENTAVITTAKKELDNDQSLPALRAVLQDLKARIAIDPSIKHEDEPQDPQLMRLDNMLVAEGVATEDGRGHPISSAAVAAAAAATMSGQMSPSEGIIENQDYKTKLAEIRNVYNSELDRYHQVSGCRGRLYLRYQYVDPQTN